MLYGAPARTIVDYGVDDICAYSQDRTGIRKEDSDGLSDALSYCFSP